MAVTHGDATDSTCALSSPRVQGNTLDIAVRRVAGGKTGIHYYAIKLTVLEAVEFKGYALVLRKRKRDILGKDWKMRWVTLAGSTVRRGKHPCRVAKYNSYHLLTCAHQRRPPTPRYQSSRNLLRRSPSIPWI